VIALIDYGAGNLTSVRKALGAVGADVSTPIAPDDLERARGIIVPGVGHFDATRAIDEPWCDAIRTALDRGAALLGICLGMQWLFEGSEESPHLPGFGTFQGTCCRLESGGTPQSEQGAAASLKTPHVGWNSLTLARPTTLMAGVPDAAQVYFTHSYVAPPTPDAATTTTHGVTFVSAVERGRISGVQFHPEKSGDIGLRILRNWLNAL